MRVLFCAPKLTMNNVDEANDFFDRCKEILDEYVANKQYVYNEFLINQLLSEYVDQSDILCFFTSESGKYTEIILRLITKYSEGNCRVWAIAMYGNSECRMPPPPMSERQSYDVSCRNENRNPLKNNMRAIAQVFARKIVSQVLLPLYLDEVSYFISYRRADGEHIAARLADKLRLLTRERNVYRDVVKVEVGDDAQKDIDKNLRVSDAVIFLQTKLASDSSYIVKELCYALINSIPILWIQIDDASYSDMEIRPGEAPLLSYKSEDFDCEERLIEIADEVEEMCFRLIMNSSSQVYSYAEILRELCKKYNYKLTNVQNNVLAYEIEYRVRTGDVYDSDLRHHYIQCFGRNLREIDRDWFRKKVMGRNDIYQRNDKLILLSGHGGRVSKGVDTKIIEENYDDYFMNLEKISGNYGTKKNKKIILSGAFPDNDEIYKQSLLEALTVYSKEIIKRGYTLVFGSHPTFQKIIFDIGDLYASDVQYSIEMHMDRAYINRYNADELQSKCNLILSDGLQKMREEMICQNASALLICLGGKIKENKAEQGVDIEVKLAQEAGIPIALVGSAGGRSGQYAFEKLTTGDWSELNQWDKSLNEDLFYKVNHRLMAKTLLSELERGNI